MNIEEIRQALYANGLARLADEVERLIVPAIHIEPHKAKEQSLKTGASKIGGRPDLPAGVPWPMRDGRLLGFLAQFNLSELAAYDSEHLLPPTGLCSFFYDFQAAPWGLKPEDRGGWQVLHFEGNETTFARAEWPESMPELFRLPAQRPVFSCKLTITAEPMWVAQHELSSDELVKYREIMALYKREEFDEEEEDEDDPISGFEYLATRHQLLGHPTLVHYGRMAWESESLAGTHPTPTFAAQRFKSNDTLDDHVRPLIKEAFGRWQLLFQIGNISGLPFPEGDEEDDDPVWRLSELCDLWARGGLMYFWIERDRLARRDFSNVWLLGASQL